jgi:shikimate dehydrogenase
MNREMTNLQVKQQNFAVAGNPVSHSLSPLLFGDFVAQTGQNYCYSRVLAKNTGQIMEIVEAFNIRGMNITSPFKQDILKFVDFKSENVLDLNAANTLVFNEQISAYNSDVSGVKISLGKQIGHSRKAIVLGAGGAAKAAVLALKKSGYEEVFIANRTENKAKEIAEKFEITAVLFEDIGNKYFDVIINTIPLFVEPVNNLKITVRSIVFDANYKNKPLKDIAKRKNAIYIDGIEWLIAQGIESYSRMTGFKTKDLHLEKEDIEKIKDRSQTITLIGSMASGKSKVGRNLAKKLGFDFVDMDDIIVSSEGRSINDIFESEGEDYFRKIEKQFLQKLISKDKIVISTGGGIIKDDENIRTLKSNCWNILLYASSGVRSSRINTDKRPLLKGKNVKSIMDKLFSERKNKYFKASDVIINRNNNDLIKDIELIYEDYNKAFGV